MADPVTAALLAGGVSIASSGIQAIINGGNKPKKISTLDKTQKNIYKDYAAGINGQGPQADLFNFNPEQTTDVFNKIYAQPAAENFKRNIVPSITGAFRGGNIQNSSYAGQALAQAGTDVQTNLNAHMSKMLYDAQNSSIERRLGAIRDILGVQTFAYQKPQQGAGDAFFSGLSSGAQDLGFEYAKKAFSPQTTNTTPPIST